MALVKFENQDVKIENIYCIGRNYAEHIAELNHTRDEEITAFLKPTASLLEQGQAIKLPNFSNNLHFEAELVLLIGKSADQVLESEALNLVAGVAIGLDLTARDTQNIAKDKGLPWLKSKGFKNSACVSEFIATSEIENLMDTNFTLSLNSQIRQVGFTKKMLYTIPQILVYLADVYGLTKNDIIFTGTPEGVGKLASGDILELNLADKLTTSFKVA